MIENNRISYFYKLKYTKNETVLVLLPNLKCLDLWNSTRFSIQSYVRMMNNALISNPLLQVEVQKDE